jgi:hypothetical protein
MELGRIENGFYIQGDLKFAVDIKDAHKTFDAVAALAQPDKIKLAKLNDIKAEPYNRQALTTILKSVVQNAWFVATTGNLPVEVATAHSGRLAQYNAQFAIPASTVDFLSRKARAASSQAKPSLQFVIDEAKYEAAYNADHNTWRGQSYLVIKSMVELKAVGTAGKTIKEIFENSKETRETPGPTRNAVNQIINKLVAAGIVTCLNPQDAKKKPEPKAKTPEAPKAPAPAGKTTHQPPAPAPKKKH